MKLTTSMLMLLSAAVLSTAADAVEPQSGMTMKEWSALPSADRQQAVMAAYEGIVIAMATPGGEALPFKEECFNNIAPEDLEVGLLTVVKEIPETNLTVAIMAVSQCK